MRSRDESDIGIYEGESYCYSLVGELSSLHDLLSLCLDCGISVVPLWSTHDNNITQLYCDLSNAAPKWWVVSDPCQQSSDSATELTECSGQGGCIVPNDLMTSSLGCVVCCTDSRISSQFTINSVGSCTELRGKWEISGI